MAAVYILGLLLVFFSGSEALTCYHCNDTDVGCSLDPIVKGDMAMYAQSDCLICSKVITSIRHVPNMVFRECITDVLLSNMTDDCYGHSHSRAACYCSDKDLCNGQTQSKTFLVVPFAAVVVILLRLYT